MASNEQDFTITSGDSLSVEITVTDQDGSPFDLTGSTMEWAAAASAQEPIRISKSSTSGGITIGVTTDIAVVNLVPADTRGERGSLYHELQVTDLLGNVSTVTTGTMFIQAGLISN